MSLIKVPANYYQQFDADFSLDVPAEGYGGWKTADVELCREHTGVVVMHAWDCGTRDQFPGWHRCVDYIPRSYKICREVFPRLLGAVRKSGLSLFHVVSNHENYKKSPGYQHAVKLAEPAPPPPTQIEWDDSVRRLRQFHSDHVFVGKHNAEDVKRGFERLDFPTEARPIGDEGIAEDALQLFALCKERGVNHLIYAGFAINWCLLLSPGGMHDMAQRGVLCSVFRDAVTAVENKETARDELCKQIALWRVSVGFGFVFD